MLWSLFTFPDEFELVGTRACQHPDATRQRSPRLAEKVALQVLAASI